MPAGTRVQAPGTATRPAQTFEVVADTPAAGRLGRPHRHLGAGRAQASRAARRASSATPASARRRPRPVRRREADASRASPEPTDWSAGFWPGSTSTTSASAATRTVAETARPSPSGVADRARHDRSSRSTATSAGCSRPTADTTVRRLPGPREPPGRAPARRSSSGRRRRRRRRRPTGDVLAGRRRDAISARRSALEDALGGDAGLGHRRLERLGRRRDDVVSVGHTPSTGRSRRGRERARRSSPSPTTARRRCRRATSALTVYVLDRRVRGAPLRVPAGPAARRRPSCGSTPRPAGGARADRRRDDDRRPAELGGARLRARDATGADTDGGAPSGLIVDLADGPRRGSLAAGAGQREPRRRSTTARPRAPCSAAATRDRRDQRFASRTRRSPYDVDAAGHAVPTHRRAGRRRRGGTRCRACTAPGRRRGLHQPDRAPTAAWSVDFGDGEQGAGCRPGAAT